MVVNPSVWGQEIRILTVRRLFNLGCLRRKIFMQVQPGQRLRLPGNGVCMSNKEQYICKQAEEYTHNRGEGYFSGLLSFQFHKCRQA